MEFSLVDALNAVSKRLNGEFVNWKFGENGMDYVSIEMSKPCEVSHDHLFLEKSAELEKNI